MYRSVSVCSLFQYPLKSGAAFEVTSLDIDFSGARLDRKWMIVNQRGEFITGRTHPKLVMLKAQFEGSGLVLAHAAFNSKPIQIPHENHTEVQVWKDTFTAFDAGDYANDFVSDFLGESVRLVYSDSSQRKVRWQTSHTHAFSDAAPLLVVSKASLELISDSAKLKPDPRRFRPNIVLEGLPAFGEDGLGRLGLGEVEIQLVDGCSRCDFTLVDPDTGLIDTLGEPVATLERMRKNDVGIYLGVNAIVTKPGIIKIGDKANVITEKRPTFFTFDVGEITFSHQAVQNDELTIVKRPVDQGDYVLLSLETNGPLQILPGQYVCLEFNGSNIGNRSYSVVSYTDSQLLVAIKKVKDQTASPHRIKNLPEGYTVKLLEIGGAFPHISLAAETQIWLSAGSGVTPFLGLLSTLSANNKNPSIVWLHFGNSSQESDLIDSYTKLYELRLSKLEYHCFDTKREERINREHFETFALDLRDRVTLCCGPKGFRDRCREILNDFGLSISKRFFVERYGPEELEIPHNLLVKPGHITIGSRDKKIRAPGDQSILKTLAEAGIELRNLCKAGECGRCKFKLVSGEVSQIGFELLTSKDKEQGLKLACVNFNKGDIEIEIENI